ncbi:Arylphorin subunit alpha, partial [Gonioctena quinquepunctata]
EKTTLEKQKQLLALLYHVQQVIPEHAKIAEGFSPFDTSLYEKDDGVKKFREHWKYDPLAKGAIFSITEERHLPQAVALFKMLYYAKDYETFYKTAVWARVNVNEGLFVYSFYVAVVHRADTKGIMLPPIYEVTPNMFFGADVIQEAQYYKQVHVAQQHGEAKGYIINSNYSNQHLNLDHEQTSLAYYLQDVGVNSFSIICISIFHSG